MRKNFFYPIRTLLPALLAVCWTAVGCGPIASHYDQKGAEAFARKDLPQARHYFEKALLFQGKDPAILNNLGYVLYLQKDYDGAETQYRKALEGDVPSKLLRQVLIDQAELYCDPRVLQDHKDWPAMGIQDYQRLLLEEPQNAEYHLRIGMAYFHLSNPGGGFEELAKAVQLAEPSIVSRYTPDGKAGALEILRQVQAFYLGIKYAKGAVQVGKKIAILEK